MSHADGVKLGTIIKSRLVFAEGDLPEGADYEDPKYRDRITKIVEVTEYPDRPAETQVIYDRG